MNREYHAAHSSVLGRPMEFLVFGHGGTPVLVFPTTMGRFYQYEDFGMVAALGPKLDAGLLQLFCIDSLDGESWYNRDVHPRQRVLRHTEYERYILEELLPEIRGRNPNPLAVTGTSFGAYHAVNFAMRHPELVRKLVVLSGRYDIRGFLGGYYDDDVYFNNPVDYLPNLRDDRYLGPLRAMEIALVAAEHDLARASTEHLSRILRELGVPHQLHIWTGYVHDWPVWRDAIPHYL